MDMLCTVCQSTPAAHSNCFSASVNIMLICKAFLKIIGAAAVEQRGMYVVGQWHVSAGGPIQPHICATDVGTMPLCPRLSPLDFSPLTGGNTSRVNNGFSQVVPNRRAGEEATRQTGRGRGQKSTTTLEAL